jgi:hypothetical protein
LVCLGGLWLRCSGRKRRRRKRRRRRRMNRATESGCIAAEYVKATIR